MTRRRLLGGLSAIGAVGVASGAGTWAYFSDTEESSGNTIEAGTLDLKVADTDEGFGDGVSGTWTISNAKPGDSVLADLTLQNAGSLEADHVEIGFSVDETEADGSTGTNEADTMPSSADGMADQFEVTVFTYNGTNVRSNLSDANSNGIVDIDDLVTGNGAVLDDLSPPPSANGGTESMTMEFRWAHDDEFDNSVSGINNDYQGDEFDLTVTYALHQDSGQDL
ncbi:TasA family protein [Natrinema sp. CGMCC1.2065]|uniref:TasA family protein n=1 Tax=Natrinema sp. CGMCC1.2065 TaxID=3445767 RepID=UPI003F49EF1C